MKATINLNGKVIEKKSKDFYFIAEIGTNFVEIAEKQDKSYETAAREMIEAAAKAGANAVKFQIYDESLASEKEALDQYKYLYKHSVLTTASYNRLMEVAEKNKVDFIATLFTDQSIDTFGDKLKIFKIASPDITNKPLIRRLGSYHKPILLSTGGSTLDEISRVLDWIGHEEVVIMHCTGTYPTQMDEINFAMIRNLNDFFEKFVVGYSDHIRPETLDNSPLYAFLMGANVIEKHFTTDRNIVENDHIHSYSPAFLSANVERLKEAQVAFGDCHKKPIEAERNLILFGRRSVAANQFIQKGELILHTKLKTIRPATGIQPYDIGQVIGKRAKQNIDKNTIIEYNMLGD